MQLSSGQCERLERRAQQDRLERERAGHQPGHPDIDRRALALTRLAVARIDSNPRLVQVGLDNIERWTRQNGGYLSPAHAEWKALIEQHPWQQLRRILLEDSDEGQRLRSSHPFKGIITPEERTRVYAARGP